MPSQEGIETRGKANVSSRCLGLLIGGCLVSLVLNVLLIALVWSYSVEDASEAPCWRQALATVTEAAPRVGLLLNDEFHENVVDVLRVDAFRGYAVPPLMTVDAAPRALATVSMDCNESSEHADEHESHPHDALIFLFIALLVGTCVLNLKLHRHLENLQETVTLFVIGIMYSMVFRGLDLRKDAGVVGVSYDMWIGIDPHLILFTMLPALLAGDAMAADTTVVKRVAGQCMFLAGPGLIACTMLSAVFLQYYLDWSFELALTLGAILAATDPVAVVNLLKQLGASPALTVRIQGESLLNDGTAIVLFTMAYEMLKGETFNVAEIIIFVVRKAICPAGIGWVIGWVFVLWINAAGNRFQHNSSTVQICLTLCCAYWSFIIAEGVLDMSGVLCTVASSLVLADNMWHSIVEKQTLVHVWHIFEFLGNTVIFFLAGALTGDTMLHVGWEDYAHLFVIYIVLTVIRGVVIFLSLPIMGMMTAGGKKATKKLEVAEAIVLAWGGLRGAVGLALAMQVRQDKANDTLHVDDARRVLFFTGGIAFLTLVINATTCPLLVKTLGLVQTDQTKRRLLLGLYQQMLHKVDEHVQKEGMDRLLKEMMEEVAQKISAAKASGSHTIDQANLRLHQHSHASHMGAEMSELSQTMGGTRSEAMQGTVSMASYRQEVSKGMAFVRRALTRRIEMATDGAVLVRAYQRAFRRLEQIRSEKLQYLNVPALEKLHIAPSFLRMTSRQAPEVNMLRLINEAFLNMVRHEYWKQIEAGEFIDGSSQPDRLLNSVAFAVQSNSTELEDFDFLVRDMGLSKKADREESDGFSSGAPTTTCSQASPTPTVKTGISDLTDGSPQSLPPAKRDSFSLGPPAVSRRSSAASQALQMSAVISMVEENTIGHDCITRLVKSATFNAFITIAILSNVIHIFVEDQVRDEADTDIGLWMAVEVFFFFVFTVEFLLKLAAERRAYFKDAWNVFDCTLVAMGAIGLAVDIAAASNDSGGANVSSEARVFRINRIFRVMRLMRVFRLVKFVQVLRAKLSGRELSVELAKSMRSISMLCAFARAHYLAQRRLQVYFGEASGLQGVELSRCIVDSAGLVCAAITLAASEVHNLELTILKSLATLRESSRVTEELNSFIMEAAEIGIMNPIEASSLLQPLRDYSQKWYMQAQEQEMGIMSPFSPKSMTTMMEDESGRDDGSPSRVKGIRPPDGEGPQVLQPLRLAACEESEEETLERRSGQLGPAKSPIPQHSDIFKSEAQDRFEETYGSHMCPPPPNAKEWFESSSDHEPALPNQLAEPSD